MSLLVTFCIDNLWKADQLGSNIMAVRSVALHIATHSLAEHGSSSAQLLQWQQVRQVTTDIFFDGCFVFVGTGHLRLL